ncbi:amidohydrolase, partial [Leptospira sp. severe_002]|uniref:amidohydrolase family protein n=1 Tax=Leptospira sp. severe_002 TaxID=2838237 RepID=UPI001E59114A
MLCDSHVHIVAPIDAHPQAANRTYVADVAPVDALQRFGIERGVTRFVIVQPSFYGTDNTVTLKALDDLNGNGRGVAVIDPKDITSEQLADFHKRGVRGLRMNLYSPMKAAGSKSLGDGFAAMAYVARDMKWHVQV